jgi:hypothetical protein
VTGNGPHGSTVSAAGTTAPDEYGRRRWWDTGGPVRAVDQGSVPGSADPVNQRSAPGSADALEQPAAGAVSLTMVDLAGAGATGYRTTAGNLDLLLVRSGTMTAMLDAAPASPTAQRRELSLSVSDVLLTRGVAVSLTSTAAAELAVVSFSPAQV